jgi:hypothetical protein
MSEMTAPNVVMLDAADEAFLRERADFIRSLVKSTAENVVGIGTALANVKERLPHGAWLPWLDREFGWSERQAQNFLRVGAAFKSAKFADLDDLVARIGPGGVERLDRVGERPLS